MRQRYLTLAVRLDPRLEGLLIWGVMGVALVLRLITLAGRGLEYDDAFSILLSRQPLARIVAGTAADTMPPGYYFLLHAWMALGEQLWLMRALNVILSVGIVALLYRLVGELADRRSAVLAALFAAVSPLQIFHAQGLRMYVMLAISLLGYVWFFWRVWNPPGSPASPRWLDWAGLVFCGVLAMYSHNLAIFTLLTPAAFLILRREWRKLSRLIAAQAAIALLALPWLLVLPTQLAKVQAAFWTPRPGVLEILQAILSFHTNLPVPPAALPVAIAVSLLAIVFVAAETIFTGREDRGVALLAGLAILPPLGLLAVSYLMRPVFLPRSLLLSSLAYYGLAGIAVSRARWRPVGYAIAGCFLLASWIGLPGQYGDVSFPRSPFEEAAGWLRQGAIPGDLVLHDNKLSFFPMHVYAPDLPQAFLADPPGSHNDTLAPATQDAMNLHPFVDLESTLARSRRVWFVVFTRAIQEYRLSRGVEHPALGWFNDAFKFIDRAAFNDLEIYLFESPMVEEVKAP